MADNRQTATQEPKRPNWTPYAIVWALLLGLGMFFLIDADAPRHSAGTTTLWQWLAGVCLVACVALWFVANALTKRRR